MGSIGDLANWTEVTRGLYRYVISTKVCYEIYIMNWNMRTAKISANCSLYIVGEWCTDDGIVFERELLLTGPLGACVEAAKEDNTKNNS